jgi:hypothetical protein
MNAKTGLLKWRCEQLGHPLDDTLRQKLENAMMNTVNGTTCVQQEDRKYFMG